MVDSHNEMSHILGLLDYPSLAIEKNEGWMDYLALSSIKNRYKQLNKDASSPVNFHRLPGLFSNQKAKDVGKMKEGDYVGYAANWQSLGDITKFELVSGHAYTIHMVKEGEQTHFIYVNRGQRHFDVKTGEDKHDAPAVMVFSIDTNQSTQFANELFGAASSFNSRRGMSEFLAKHEASQNQMLGGVLSKKDQRTGNCTVANSNIAWHFQLASDYMKKNKTSFAEAYIATDKKYKGMRLQDRVNAVQYLVNDRNFYLNDRYYRYNYFQAIDKLSIKDYLKQSNHLETLIKSSDDKTLQELINPLLSDNFSNDVDLYIQDRLQRYCASATPSAEEVEEFKSITRANLFTARENILVLALQRLPSKTQEVIVANDISLLRGAAPTIQKAYLERDFNKYCLYASEDLKKEFREYQIPENNRTYLKAAFNTSCEQKTSGNLLLARNAEQKEAKINNKMRELYSFLSVNDSENINRAFTELCEICGEKRFSLVGDNYSTNTASAKWLIEKFKGNDGVAVEFRASLNLQNPEAVQAKVEQIIAQKNAPNLSNSSAYKERYNSLVSSKTTEASDQLNDEKQVSYKH